MPGMSLPQLSPSIVSVVQWTLVGIELLVLAYVVVWLGRNSRLGGLARPFRRRAAVAGEGTAEAARAGRARLVSMGGGPPTAVRTDATPRPRSLRLSRTPPRGHGAIGEERARAMPDALHCPGCGTLLARGEPIPRLVTRCTGCDRRVAVRTDGDRLVVTLES